MLSPKKNYEENEAAWLSDNGEHRYQRFYFNREYEHIFNDTHYERIDFLLLDRHFICPQRVLEKSCFIAASEKSIYKIEKAHCEIFYNILLKNHGLVAGKVLSREAMKKIDKADIFLLNHFKNHLLNLEFEWSHRFLKTICEYLKTRNVSQGPLFNQSSIQIALGEVVSYLEAANVLQKHLSTALIDHQLPYQNAIYQEIKKANHLLAKLAGGRAFLSGNVVEMILVFEFFHDVYFSGKEP